MATQAAEFPVAVESETLSGGNGATVVAAGNTKGQTVELSKPVELQGLILGIHEVTTAADLTVAIAALDGEIPTGDPFYSKTGNLPDGLKAGDSVRIEFEEPLSLPAGRHAIILTTEQSNLRFRISSGYQRGNLIRRNTSTNGSWKQGNGADSDLVFRLFGKEEIASSGSAVSTAPPPELVMHENPVFEAGSLSDLQRQPNIITIMVDDLGWNQIGVSQATFGTNPSMYVTPNLARLANEGLSFTNAYAQPNCAPTRAAMLSGQYPARIHNDVYVVNSLNRNGGGGISKSDAKFIGPDQSEDVAPEAITVAEALRENGYATAHIGKYHAGGHRGEETLPENVGFDINIGGFSQGHQPVCFATKDEDETWAFRKLGRGHFDRFAEPYTVEYLERHDFPSSLAGTPKHVSDAVADAMEETVETFSAEEKPFYLQLHPYAVHGPVRSRPDLQEASGGDALVGFVRSVDLIVGRVLKAIEDPNGDGNKNDSIEGNTLVMFTSDNGGTHKNNLPLRGKKGMFTEGGIRVPLIARWPGRIPANTVTDHLVHSVDYYPTYLQLAGEKWRPNSDEHPLDGFSFVEALLDPNLDAPRQPIFYLFPGYLDSRAQPSATVIEQIGDAQFKLIYTYETDAWELYNITEDLSESHNLVEEHPEVASGLAKKMRSWLDQEHSTWKPKYPIAKDTKEPVGLPAW
ncbi:MAG: sulfatase [Verrucomicrobiota bacterium]